jgi:hypothetical protein
LSLCRNADAVLLAVSIRSQDVNLEIIVMDVQNLLTVAQLAELNPALTEPTLRWWIFTDEAFGFAKCLVRIRGRVFIDRAAFEAWLEEHRTAELL